MTKAERDALQIQVIALAQHVGQRAAARECGLSESTVMSWILRYKRKHGAIIPYEQIPTRSPTIDPDGTHPVQAMQAVIARHSDESKLALAHAGTKSSNQFADMPAEQLVQRDTAIAFDATSRALDRTHGWSISQQQAPNVSVAVQVNMPTQAERDEMRQLDAKLDAFAKLLKDKQA